MESCEVIPGVSKEELIRIIASVEKNSTHPIAKAIVSYAEKKKIGLTAAENIEEVAGYGLMTEVDGEKCWSVTPDCCRNIPLSFRRIFFR